MRDAPLPDDPGRKKALRDQLLEAHTRRLYGLCYSCLRHAQDAEDMMNDIIVLVLRKWDKYKPEQPFWPWLRLVAMNCIASKTRPKAWKDRKNSVPYDDVHDDDSELEPLDELVTQEDRALVQEASGTLPEHLRVVLIFFHFEEMSLKEIAAATGRPVGTLGRWLREARALVKDYVEQHHPAGEPVLPNR